MKAVTRRRSFLAVAISTLLLVSATTVVGLTADAPDEHPVVGRWTITSDAGGGVWAFQPGGLLVLTGPGGISSEGRWSAADGERGVDATLDYQGTGQELTILGEVSEDLSRLAVYIVASEAERPEDADPWPPVSRLIGERFGMVADASPSPLPLECSRPTWVDDVVDWDRCDEGITPA